jgi:hypothetical protein
MELRSSTNLFLILTINRNSNTLFNLLNMANVVLLPKKEQALTIGDYKPISLVHSVAKIFSKTLAKRLAMHLTNMGSSNQSVFVKKDAYKTISRWYKV